MPELRSKIKVMYNPPPPELINREQAKNLSEVPTFLYLGGDSYIKGFHVLLQVLNKLGKQGIKARFIFANKYNFQSLKMLKRLGEKYSNLDIQVQGRVKHGKLVELHRKTWSLLFPSIGEETYGYAIVEASILGTMPIASRVGAIPELLGDTIASKYLFSPSNYVELAGKIAEICHLSMDEIIYIGKTLSKDMLKKFSQSNIENRVIEVFRDLLK